MRRPVHGPIRAGELAREHARRFRISGRPPGRRRHADSSERGTASGARRLTRRTDGPPVDRLHGPPARDHRGTSMRARRRACACDAAVISRPLRTAPRRATGTSRRERVAARAPDRISTVCLRRARETERSALRNAGLRSSRAERRHSASSSRHEHTHAGCQQRWRGHGRAVGMSAAPPTNPGRVRSSGSRVP